MELRQLEYFVAVADELSFSRGARRVHVVQSAVSTAVAKLERELNIVLLDRSKPRVGLTAAGAAFLAEARATLNAARRAKESVVGFHGQLSGSVDVGTMMSTGPIDLPEALGRFHRAHPLVTVRLRQNVSGSLGHLAAIADGSLDIAMVAVPGKPPASVTLRLLAEEPLVFLCWPDHPLAGRDAVVLTQLAGEVLVRFASGWGIRDRIDRALADAGIDPVSPYEVADYATAAGLIHHRLGTTLIPRSAAVRFPELRAVPVTPALTWQLSLATAAGRRLSPAVAALADTLTGGASAD
ncbi:MAG TPA: LysR family transcriptional regulator [Pseudonocardia sp.]|uniref:LysR family transcriptional regulator n=1 Tax=Pseudonocardia sp. TaxID=60912 RepID=UPI002D0CED1A|nr:LysR family transcriptional regulator [Pseudonocardia sp.]HTF48378.1 LysR family transcriptional regulator [Pseudonocardia sp.]